MDQTLNLILSPFDHLVSDPFKTENSYVHCSLKYVICLSLHCLSSFVVIILF